MTGIFNGSRSQPRGKSRKASSSRGSETLTAELRLDRQVRGVHKALGDGWSDHTARRRRDIIGVYAESIDRAALGITGHGGEKKAGKRKRTQTKRYPAPRYGETDW